MYLDTGATYRCVTVAILKENVKLDELDKIQKILDNIKIEFKDDKVFLNDEDVTKKIIEKEVTELCSQVSHIKIVRENMVNLQRRMAKDKDVILDGRDIRNSCIS